MDFAVVIPARYASTRLPGKPLRLIRGMPMIEHVYRRALESGAVRVAIAVDDERVLEACNAFGADVVMTSADHASGTDRIAEVARGWECGDDAIIVNVQGDEPLIPPVLIRQVAENLSARPHASIATLCERIERVEDLFAPQVVKVVTDAQGYALYFSRAAVPWDRDAFAQDAAVLPATDYFRHIGLYAYRAGFLREFAAWEPCPPEQAEALEQLRALWHGYRIHVAEAQARSAPGVDTQEDLTRVAALLGDRVTVGQSVPSRGIRD